MQQIRKRAYVLQTSFTNLFAFFQHVFDFDRQVFPPLKRRNTEAQGEQILRRSIMQFPGNTPAFLILNVQQAQRKGTKFFFGDLQLCNIGGGADELFGSPISPSRKYGCTPMDPTPFSVLMPQSENVLEDFAVLALHVLSSKTRKICHIDRL